MNTKIRHVILHEDTTLHENSLFIGFYRTKTFVEDHKSYSKHYIYAFTLLSTGTNSTLFYTFSLATSGVLSLPENFTVCLRKKIGG